MAMDWPNKMNFTIQDQSKYDLDVTLTHLWTYSFSYSLLLPTYIYHLIPLPIHIKWISESESLQLQELSQSFILKASLNQILFSCFGFAVDISKEHNK